jgi:DNA-3-methyladenine glycosylase I
MPMSSYCDFAKSNPIHGTYHDREYGFPIEDESLLFERLLQEINQAGLSWELMLKKREGFRRAYVGNAVHGPYHDRVNFASIWQWRSRSGADSCVLRAQTASPLPLARGFTGADFGGLDALSYD